MSRFCLTLICAREVEERLLDTLLTHGDGTVFTSTPTFSHGEAPARLSNAEKVMGRSRSVQVQIITSEAGLATLVETLKWQFQGTGLRYWATAVTTDGEVA